MNPIDSRRCPMVYEEQSQNPRWPCEDRLAVSRRAPTVKIRPVEISVAGAISSEVSRERLGLKHRGGHDDLKTDPGASCP